MLALPEMSRAAAAVGSRTMIDRLTVIVLVVVLLAVKLPSPEYDTLIECEPGVRLATLSAAVPPVNAIVARSSPVVVSKKSTVPVGVPDPGALAATVAVTVIVWPNGSAVADACAEVVLGSAVIVSLKEFEVLP